MIASAERTFAIHPERQFMHYLREQRWVKGTTFPPGQLAASLQKKGWIEQQRQGPKNETFYRITDAGPCRYRQAGQNCRVPVFSLS